MGGDKEEDGARDPHGLGTREMDKTAVTGGDVGVEEYERMGI